MNTTRISRIVAALVAAIFFCGSVGIADPLGTAFTYQGRLIDSNGPANGSYDFQFRLYDANSEGSQIGADIDVADVNIVDGYFTAGLDFSSGAFDGEERWLEIAVRPYDSTDPGDYVALAPLQSITAAPYAQYALKSGGFILPVALAGSGADPLFRIDGTGTGYSIYGTAQDVSGVAVYGYHANGGHMGYLGTDAAGVRGYSAGGYAGLFDGKTKVAGNLTVEGTGKVGIGTASPASKLHVSDSSSSYGMIRAENSAAGDNEATMGFKEGADAASSDIWVIGVGGWGNTSDFVVGRGAAKLLVEPDGDVGIGTTAPSQKLEVSGAVKASRTGADGPNLIIHDTNGSNDRPGIQFTNNNIHYIGGDDGSNEYFGFYSQYGNNRIYDAVVNIHGKATANWGRYLSLTHDGTNGIIGTDAGHILLLPNQSVAIGTTAPSGKLDVYTNLNDYGIYSRNEKSGNFHSYGIYGSANNSESVAASYSVGVRGDAPGNASENIGVHGTASGNTARYSFGVRGESSSSSGANIGVYGSATTASPETNFGVYGKAQNTSGSAYAGYFHGNVYVYSGNVGIGTGTPAGKLDVNGSIYQRGAVLHADYVFEPDYKLESIDEHSEFMWQEKHLPAMPKMQKDENGREIVEIGARSRGIVEELEKAHIYIEQLNKENKELRARLTTLDARLDAMESLVAKSSVRQEGGAK